jgi:hypothetical protein
MNPIRLQALALSGLCLSLMACAAEVDPNVSEDESELAQRVEGVTVERSATTSTFRVTLPKGALAHAKSAFAQPLPGMTLVSQADKDIFTLTVPNTELGAASRGAFSVSARGFDVSIQSKRGIAAKLNDAGQIQVNKAVHDNTGASHFNAEWTEAEFSSDGGRFAIDCDEGWSSGPMCKIHVAPRELARRSEAVKLEGDSLETRVMTQKYEAEGVLNALGNPRESNPYGPVRFSDQGTDDGHFSSYGVALLGQKMPNKTPVWSAVEISFDRSSLSSARFVNGLATVAAAGNGAVILKKFARSIDGLSCSDARCTLSSR